MCSEVVRSITAVFMSADGTIRFADTGRRTAIAVSLVQMGAAPVLADMVMLAVFLRPLACRIMIVRV